MYGASFFSQQVRSVSISNKEKDEFLSPVPYKGGIRGEKKRFPFFLLSPS